MSTARLVFAVLFASSTSLLACSAAPETTEEPSSGEESSETSSALANTGGGGGLGLTAGECTGCGCTLVFDHKDDTCRYYKCVCDSEAKAKCAGGKAKLVSLPNPKRPVFTGGTVGVLASP